MTETQTELYGEAVAGEGQIFTAVKATSSQYLTTVERDVIVYSQGDTAGPIGESMRLTAPSAVYNYEWHANERDFLLLLRDLPMRLCNRTKVLRSYVVLNNLDEVKSPLAAGFQGRSGEWLWTGLGKSVYRFDVETGTDCRFAMDASGGKVSAKTVVSAIGASEGLVAVGTYSKLAYIFSPALSRPVSVLEGHSGGLVQCLFRDYVLYTGSRCDCSVFAWDLRSPQSPLNTFAFYRDCRTPQRVLFDVSGSLLSVGNADGSVYRYDVRTGELQSAFRAHFDAVSSVQSAGNFLVTSAGQRHFYGAEVARSSIRLWRLPVPTTAQVASK